MPDHEELFASLRERLQQPPSEELWDELVELLHQWDDPDVLREVVVPYAHEHLTRWDDALREPSRQWVDRAYAHLHGEGQDDGLLSLGRSFTAYQEERKEIDLAVICSPLFAPYTHLRLQLNDLTRDELRGVIEAPHTKNVKGLQLIWCALEDDDIALLKEARWQLESLDLHGNELSDEAVGALLRHPSLHGLHTLELGYIDEINVATMEALADGPYELMALNLDSCNRMTAEALATLTTSQAFETLEVFKLSSLDINPYDEDETQLGKILVSAPHPPPLKTFDISFCNVQDIDVVALATWPAMATVERWELNYHYASERGMQALSQSPYLRKLKHLDLSCAQAWNDAALSALFKAQWLEGLTWLRLWSCNIGPAQADKLAKEARLDQLKELSLWENPLGPTGLEAILEAPWLDHLERLNMADCQLTEGGIEYLARSPRTARLLELRLEQNGVLATGALALLSSPHLGQLEDLFLCQNQLGGLSRRGPLPRAVLSQLKALFLHEAQLTFEDLEALCDALDQGHQLKRLGLNGNPLGDDGLARLMASPAIGRIEAVFLESWEITDKGCQMLLDAADGLQGTTFHLDHNQITPKMVDALKAGLDVYISEPQ